MKVGRLVTVLALVLGAAGCGQAGAVPQASGGPGWTLLRTIDFVDRRMGIAYALSGSDAYELQIIVLGTGGGGCGAPRFTGFNTIGSIYLATIERGPMPGDACLVHSQVEYDVLLERDSIPKTVTGLAVNEHCDFVGCEGSPIPFEP